MRTMNQKILLAGFLWTIAIMVNSCQFMGIDRIGTLREKSGVYVGEAKLRGKHQAIVIDIPSAMDDPVASKMVKV